MKNGGFDGRFLTVTFDDGYEGVARNAYPILRQLAIPGTVFVCGSSLAEGIESWDIAVLRLLKARRLDQVAAATGIPGDILRSPSAFVTIRDRWSPAMGERLVRAAAVLSEPASPRYISLGDIARFDPSIMTVGNHSWSHPPFSRLTPEEVTEEIDRTHRLVSNLTAFAPAFAYPFGQVCDMNPQPVGEAARMRRLTIVGVDNRVNRAGQDAAHALSRMNAPAGMHMPWDLTIPSMSSLRMNRPPVSSGCKA